VPSSTYIGTGELNATLNIGSSYADADIVVAIDAASRACDGYKSTRFWATTETRYYTGCPGDMYVDVDELANTATVLFDIDGDGTHETTLTSGTDFFFDPVNAANDSAPYRRIVLYNQSGRRFPSYQNSVKVTGSFGWPAVPAAVKQATSILAGRLLKRARETPYGIVVVSGDAVAAARLGRIDPDVAFLLDNLPGDTPLMAI
jgi:hypothetical protein